jgi:hypothetical protein
MRGSGEGQRQTVRGGRAGQEGKGKRGCLERVRGRGAGSHDKGAGEGRAREAEGLHGLERAQGACITGPDQLTLVILHFKICHSKMPMTC